MIQDLFSNGIVRLYHISTTFLQKIEKIALTSNRKACNIIQVVSERNTASDGEQLPGAERYAGRSYDRRLIRK